MGGYYESKLSGERLRRCYELASPRVQRYLEAEIRHVLATLRPREDILELGCGYGRVASRLCGESRHVTGIDTSEASLKLARALFGTYPQLEFARMDAVRLQFPAGRFDTVMCIQNGLCAFGVQPESLFREALRVARPGGRLLFSTYADSFWPHRLAWFEAQAAAGLLGAIDAAASGDGVIACTDGFRSGRMTPAELQSLCARFGVAGTIRTIDASSVFCHVHVPS